jgi:ABC-2 type transport system permease protein
MRQLSRYFRLWLAFARVGLVRELSFRTNFLIKITVEVLWLGILLIFYETVFRQTNMVAEWSEAEYLFFLGCYYTLGGVIETLFLENCNEFADLVRSGDLDFYLLKPMDEQFLITCRNMDWSTMPNLILGMAVMIFALVQKNWQFDAVRAGLFVAMFGCGTVLAYGFLLAMTSASIWFMRNQSLYEMWWLFSTLMRYPREIFGRWASPAAWFFSFAVPIMLVTNVPARIMVKTLFDPWLVAYTFLATLVVLVLSRRFFRRALKRYRSASS